MSTLSRVRLEIDLGKLANNVRELKRRVTPCRFMAVLKANAYGLGVTPVAQTMTNCGVDYFGVAEINEALELLPFGKPIQILGNLLPDEIAPAVEHGILIPLNDYHTAKKISDEAIRQKKTARCSLTIDTGMGRLGMVSDTALAEILRIVSLPNLAVKGIYSHFSCAFMRHDEYNLKQLSAFKLLLMELAKHDIVFEDIHMAASDALNNLPQTTQPPFNLARSGINLYGFYDNEVHQSMRLNPVVELKTKLAAVRTLPAGSHIGYGRTYKLLKETRVGTIAAGYADGLPLALSNRGFVLIDGQLCPVLGRISMDYTTVSLDNAPDAAPGDEVVCFGGQADQFISVDQWAQLKGTHAYDILCSIGPRVARVCIHG